MELDSRALTDFYATPMGQVARRAIMAKVRAFWPQAKGLRVLGYGFAGPYVRPYWSESERVIAAMPAPYGAQGLAHDKLAWVLCEEDALPFADMLFDRILVVHGLESAEGLRPLLRQLWRVLAPEGRLLIVAPNRASLWAQVERSPFGVGRPFSRGELDQLLRESLFEPGRWDRALYAPPLNRRGFLGKGGGWERLGARLTPALGGVHVVEAAKSIYAAATPRRLKEARRARLSAAGQDF